MFFQCRSTTLREDIASDSEDKGGWSVEHTDSPFRVLDFLDTRAILLYNETVKMYTARELTRPENILAAFQGIGNIIGTHLGADLVFGLPRSHFDYALLWDTKKAPDPRLPRKHGEETQSPNDNQSAQGKREFPSWSWCGWENSVMEYKSDTTVSGPIGDLHDWLVNHTWIVWFIRDGQGSLKLVWDKTQAKEGGPKTLNSWEGYAKTPVSDTDQDLNPYGRAASQQAQAAKYPTRFSKSIPEYPFGVHINTPGSPATSEAYGDDQMFLQFYTWSAFFRLGEHLSSHSPDMETDTGLQRYGILDYKDDWCGTIVLDKRREKDKKFKFGVEHEFIALSDAKNFADEEYAGWMYYISKDKAQSEWDLYYVLLIEMKDEIAYRVGLGKVYKEAFENSCRQEKKWKEFILG